MTIATVRIIPCAVSTAIFPRTISILLLLLTIILLIVLLVGKSAVESGRQVGDWPAAPAALLPASEP